MMDALNKLAKWRLVLAGWHLGSRLNSDPGTEAMRDLRESVLLLRVENNALLQLLIRRRVFGTQAFQEQVKVEAELYDKVMAQRFPGFRSDVTGMVIYDPELAAVTFKTMGFPE